MLCGDVLNCRRVWSLWNKKVYEGVFFIFLDAYWVRVANYRTLKHCGGTKKHSWTQISNQYIVFLHDSLFESLTDAHGPTTRHKDRLFAQEADCSSEMPDSSMVEKGTLEAEHPGDIWSGTTYLDLMTLGFCVRCWRDQRYNPSWGSRRMFCRIQERERESDWDWGCRIGHRIYKRCKDNEW